MSPRPRKHRRCHCPFAGSGEAVFKPAGIPMADLERQPVFYDEIEAVQLCDGQGLTQEEAGRKMGVSRGTVQRLVSAGRRKIITSIYAGKALVIDAGKDNRTFEEK